MKVVALSIALVTLANVRGWFRESNSHAEAARGAKAYRQKQYAESARAYGEAQRLAPSPRSAFNLGTAEVAAGEREQGAARLGEAMQDPALRANALFNRGNGALAANALDHAIRDYADALRANPNHAAAKRNLEIALTKKRNQQKGAGGQQQHPQQQQQQQQKQQQGGNGQQRPQPGQPDLDALLRSVQQQEQEELRRMKGRAAEGRVGW